MSGPRKGHAGRNILAGAIAAGALLTASVGLWTYNSQGSVSVPSAPAIEASLPALPAQPDVVIARSAGESVPYTIYVVSSDERADQLRADLNDANAIRAGESLDPVSSDVVVATDDSADDVLASAVSMNSTLVAGGHSPVQVVDLRH